MAISIERRNAFTRAFALYPQLIEKFVENNVTLHNTLTGNEREPSGSDEKKRIMEIIMAQFFTRLVQTRCLQMNPNPALQKFANHTVMRYHDMRIRKLGANEVLAEDRYRTALNAYEQNMSEVILTSLVEELAIIAGDQQPGDNDNQFPDWDEVDFWTDVFLSFGTNSRPHWPNWTLTAQEIFLDCKEHFRKALDGK